MPRTLLLEPLEYLLVAQHPHALAELLLCVSRMEYGIREERQLRAFAFGYMHDLELDHQAYMSLVAYR